MWRSSDKHNLGLFQKHTCRTLIILSAASDLALTLPSQHLIRCGPDCCGSMKSSLVRFYGAFLLAYSFTYLPRQTIPIVSFHLHVIPLLRCQANVHIFFDVVPSFSFAQITWSKEEGRAKRVDKDADLFSLERIWWLTMQLVFLRLFSMLDQQQEHDVQLVQRYHISMMGTSIYYNIEQ